MNRFLWISVFYIIYVLYLSTAILSFFFRFLFLSYTPFLQVPPYFWQLPQYLHDRVIFHGLNTTAGYLELILLQAAMAPITLEAYKPPE